MSRTTRSIVCPMSIATCSGTVMVLLPLALAACGGGNVPLPDLSRAVIGDTSGLVKRGEYLVRDAAVCGHCHAAQPESDPDGPLSGGMEFRNWRLGTVRAANLTSDSATGLGRWSEAEIVRAIRTGEDRDDHVLAPVMPYEWFNGMSDRDALAIARYLKSQPPVGNEVENDPNLFYRAARLLFLGPLDPPDGRAPPRGPTPEYWEYLALHVNLCADCHTQRRGIRATPDRSQLLAGSASPPSGFPVNPTNLTPDSATGIGEWSDEDFLRTLRTGVNPQGDSLHAIMPWREFRRMTEDDLRAIYLYLRTLPPINNPVPERTDEESGS